jgi:hypothetical protein
MPAQSTRGIYNPFPTYRPGTSGVYKVTLAGGYGLTEYRNDHEGKDASTTAPAKWQRDAYAYYCAIDHKWYKASGQPQPFVVGYWRLSR